MITMSTTRKRSNVVTKALLITALASGIAGMQAQPAFAYSVENNTYDFNKSFEISLIDRDPYPGAALYFTPVDVTDKNGNTLKAGTLYFKRTYYITHENWDEERVTYTSLGDAKSILGGGSSSGELSEEQKTIVKNLIANWPRVFRLVEKFFERNDDYNEYDKKT